MENEPFELKFSSEFYADRRFLLCQQCGYEYIHITRVAVHRGRDKITIVEDNISVKDEPNTSRGTIVTIEYLGECNHRGEIIFHFYKGNVEVYHRCLPFELGNMDDIFRD